jgi:hypothetical protein
LAASADRNNKNEPWYSGWLKAGKAAKTALEAKYGAAKIAVAAGKGPATKLATHTVEKLEHRFVWPLAFATEVMEMKKDADAGKSPTVIVARSVGRNLAPFAAGAAGGAVMGGATVEAGEAGGLAPAVGAFVGFAGCEAMDCEDVGADFAEQVVTGRDPRNP